MSTFYAQPYDISARGFYFETAEEYESNTAKTVNDYGQPVEEFEIQFIDGESIDAALAEALELHQGTVREFIESSKKIKPLSPSLKGLLLFVGDNKPQHGKPPFTSKHPARTAGPFAFGLCWR